MVRHAERVPDLPPRPARDEGAAISAISAAGPQVCLSVSGVKALRLFIHPSIIQQEEAMSRTVTLPPGCAGFTMEDGTQYRGREGGASPSPIAMPRSLSGRSADAG